MAQQRPINLNLRTLKFPPMAIVSILHRLSGVLIAFLIPVLLYLLDVSLRSADTFNELAACLASPWAKFFIWVFGAFFLYHLLAGMRHLMMDLGFWESLVAGRRSAIGVLSITALVIILVGMGLWLGI